MLKLELQQRPDGHYWKRGAPFIINLNGVLVHRVRSVENIYQRRDPWDWDSPRDVFSHWAVKFWCGGSVTGGTNKLIWTDNPDRDLVVCAKCEAAAVAAGQPSAEEMCGRRVCMGGVQAVRMYGCEEVEDR